MTTDFTATPIADVSGTYTGTATLSTTSLSAPSPQTISLRLVMAEKTFGSQVGESGTATVQGTSCFSTGTISGGGILGDTVALPIAMNDGATILLSGTDQDTGALKLRMGAGTSVGGKCGLLVISPFTLTRQ